MNNFYNGKMPEELNFKILYLNRFYPEMLYTHICHSHPFVELFFVLEGEGFFLKDKEKIAIKKGDLMVINPATNHCEYSSKDYPLEFFVFAFTDIYFEKNDSQIEYLIFNNETDSRIKSELGTLFEKIYSELCNEKNYHLNMIKTYFEQLIILISREKDINLKYMHNNVSQSVAICMQFIENNLTKKITLDELASTACINKFSLVKQFNKDIGQSPLNYVMNEKIKKAINMLYFSEDSVEIIAENLGFINVSHFYQQFKNFTGKTPMFYRKKSTDKI